MKSEKNNAVKGKKVHKASRPRFNVIDFLIIMLVVVCVGAVVARFTVLDDLWSTRNLNEYEMTFTASDLTYAQCIAISAAVQDDSGEKNWIYLSDGKTKLGTLIMTNDYMQNRDAIIFEKDDGNIISAIPDETIADEDVRWTVTATVICSGKYDYDNGFLLGGKQYIAPNTKLSVRIHDCDFEMMVVNIQESIENVG